MNNEHANINYHDNNQTMIITMTMKKNMTMTMNMTNLILSLLWTVLPLWHPLLSSTFPLSYNTMTGSILGSYSNIETEKVKVRKDDQRCRLKWPRRFAVKQIPRKLTQYAYLLSNIIYMNCMHFII